MGRKWGMGRKKEMMEAGVEKGVSNEKKIMVGREIMGGKGAIRKKEVMEILMEGVVVDLGDNKNYKN